MTNAPANPNDEGLAKWGKSREKKPEKPVTGRRRRRWPKVVLAILVLVLIGGGVLIAAAPSIASAVAPGYIEAAAAKEITGSIKVKKVSLGWGGPMTVGPIELLDDKGKQVGIVEAKVAPGLWTIVSERWWSKKNLDVGVVEVSGSLEVVKEADGSSNLDRATAPRGPAKPKTPSQGGGLPFDSLKGTLKLASLDVMYTDRGAPAGTPMATGVGVSKFGGDVKVDYNPKGSGLTAKADLSGGLRGGGAGAQDKLTLTADINLKQDSKGQLEMIDAKVDVLGAPIGLVDGLAGFGGELVKSIGARGDVRIVAKGSPDDATATLKAEAEGATADLAFAYKNGVLSTSKPGVVHLRSTGFVAGMPSLRAKLAELGKSVRLGAGPGVDVTIASLSIPLPKSAIGLEAAAAGKPASFDQIDLRSGVVDLTIGVGAQRGQIDTGKLSGGQEAGGFRPFSVDPIEVRLMAPQLGGPKRLTAGTRATIDGKPAGQLAVDLSVSGLLDENGHLAMGRLTKAEGEAKLLGVTTALIQPLLDAAGAKVDLAKDVGPTLDVTVRPTTTGAGADGGLPPTDVNLTIASANINASGVVRYDNGKVTTIGDGFVVDMLSAGPLAARYVNAPAGGPAGAAVLAGRMPLKITVRDLFVDLEKKPLGIGTIQAKAEVRASEATVALDLASPDDAKPAMGPSAPVVLQNLVLSASLKPGEAPAIGIDGAMSYENAPFTIKGDFTAAGLASPADAAQGQVEKLLGMKLAGRLQAQRVPRSLAKLVPAADAALNPTGTDTGAEVKRLISSLLGSTMDVVVTLDQADGAQRAKVDLNGVGATASTTARLAPKDVTVDALTLTAQLTPERAAAVLASVTPKPAEGAGPFVPMTLGGPVTLSVSAEPLKVPLKAGTLSPDLGAAGDAVVRITADQPLLVSGIPAKGKQEAAGLGNLIATARVPLSKMLGETKDPLALVVARVTADLLRPQGGGSAWQGAGGRLVAAKAEIDASYPINDGAAEQVYKLKLVDVDAVALSPLTGDPLLLPGTLGDRVQVTADVRMSGSAQAGQRITAQADVEAPRLRGASIRGNTQGDVFRVDAAKMTWTPSVAWFNKTVFTPKEGAASGPTDQLAEEATFTLDVKSLAVSMPKSDDAGNAIQGPMKPGVFAADLSLTSPRAIIRRADGKLVRAEEIRVGLTSGAKPGSVAIDAGIARLAGDDPSEAAKPSVIRGTIDNLADARGVLTPDKALVNLTGDLDTFPTPLLDSLAGMNGKVVDLLGNFLDLKVTTRDLSKESGTLELTAGAPRASAQIKGAVRPDQTFVQTGKVEIDILEMVKYEMQKKLPGGMPLVGAVEKVKGVDEPAMIRAEGLVVPLDNDMRKLNGVISVDPGTATFAFNDVFSALLRDLKQKDRGQVGQRIDPFVVKIVNGIASYDKFRLKFGEFTIETTGTADLVNKRLDVVTYVPAGAVTEEILGLFKGSLGANAKGFTAETRIPFSTKGSLDNPKTSPDLGLFVKENAGNLIEDIGKKALDDLFNKPKKNK